MSFRNHSLDIFSLNFRQLIRLGFSPMASIIKTLLDKEMHTGFGRSDFTMAVGMSSVILYLVLGMHLRRTSIVAGVSVTAHIPRHL